MHPIHPLAPSPLPAALRLARRAALAAGCAALVAGCAASSAGPAAAPAAPAGGARAGATFDPDRAPPSLAPLVARAGAAVDRLQKSLSRRLMEELSDAPNAVLVCRDEAPGLAAEVATGLGVAVGRTSLRLRNPANAPRDWVRPLLAGAGAGPAAGVRPLAIDLGDRVGYLRPIGVAAPCLKCHGPTDGFSPGVGAALAGAYPADQATGYAPGDLRGWFWAEVRK